MEEVVMPIKYFEELTFKCFPAIAGNAEIENVIFSGPETIVFWKDGEKTVVKCQDGDRYDKHIGLAMACAKKLFGNRGSYYNVFRKWIREEEKEKIVQSAQKPSEYVLEKEQSAQKPEEEMSPLAEKIGGVPDKADKPGRSRVDHGKIVALYTAKPPRSISWIADDLGCSENTVINHLKKEGLYTSNRRRKS